jgi:hypothetical protein
MPAVVHDDCGRRGSLAFSEITDADGRVGAVFDGEGGERRLEFGGRRARCVLGVEEDGAGRRELVRDVQVGQGRGAGAGLLGGGGA